MGKERKYRREKDGRCIGKKIANGREKYREKRNKKIQGN